MSTQAPLDFRALECPVHGTSVWIDCDGRATCPECGHFVQAVRSGTMQKLPKGKDIQLPLIKNGWGLWNE
jgi:hypothetical protein